VLVGYARISTSKQSPDSQRDALKSEGCERVYLDVVSGTAEELPQREAALDYLRPRDALVVRRLPRLGRSLKDLLGVIDRLDEKGADFRSVIEGMNTSSAQGRLVFQVFGALAEFERELIRERTQAGLEAARKRGNVGGRPAALDEEGIEVAQSLMRSPDVPVRQICETLGVSRSTLYRYVSPEGARRK
jgi:DNA invertase Pin-like site-specific DNA recombinase